MAAGRLRAGLPCSEYGQAVVGRSKELLLLGWRLWRRQQQVAAPAQDPKRRECQGGVIAELAGSASCHLWPRWRAGRRQWQAVCPAWRGPLPLPSCAPAAGRGNRSNH